MTTFAVEPAPAAAPATDGRHDFDFLLGAWRIANRRLVKRLAAGTEWETFSATNVARPILGGLGNVDEFRAETWRPGFIGLTLRLFNPATRQWSLYWADNQRATLDAPVVGAWHGDTGVFTSREIFNGRPIVVRFTWTRCGPDAARWEQAFSPDAGQTWETNWVMEFTREPG
ncbi:MAG: hypothetical protein HY302_16590 [Opitutae bacterium]|nr:hypothetical protein [Opitutae bacterium]